jgi:hypothetical protein
MTSIPHIDRWLAGGHRLPAGFIPIASDKPASILCVTAQGRWVRWWEGTRSIENLPADTQREVMAWAVTELGGTKAAAKSLNVSPRTIESWRAGISPLPCKTSARLAAALAE